MEIETKLKNNHNILIAAHGNSIRALCKEILQISDIKINELEIPTGNPLLINFDNKMVIDQIKYLDKERAKKIIFNT
jgi:2,3-bisphosphoglycerate-dependent phosphoglycerate mutase